MATKSYAVTGIVIKYLSGSGDSVYASWTKPQGITDLKEYSITWQYYVSGNGWINDKTTQTTTSTKSPLYTVPNNPKITKVKVTIKPVPKDSKKWTGTSKSAEIEVKKIVPPDIPPAPTLSLKETTTNASTTLIIEIDGIDISGPSKAKEVEIQVDQAQHKSSSETKAYKLYTTKKAKVDDSGHVWTSIDNVGYSNYYRAKARTIDANGNVSLWSQFGETVESRPDTPTCIEKIVPLSTSEDAVEVSIAKTPNVTMYEVEYTTDKTYFDRSEGLVQSQTSQLRTIVISGIAKSGKTYAFRARVKNSSGAVSGWTPIVVQTFGIKANPPTTWSSDTSLILGETVDLYWLHNSADGSEPTSHVITIDIYNTSNVKMDTVTITKPGDYLKDEATKYYEFDTSSYSYDFVMYWSVRTAGATGELSDSSTIRQINVYQRPTLSIMTDSLSSDAIFHGFPLSIIGYAGPSSQHAISYLLEIIATESYEDTDYLGNPIYVTAGDTVYSNTIVADSNTFNVNLGPFEVNLGNEIPYEIRCVVAMDSGLKAVSNSLVFNVEWDEALPVPNAGYYIENETAVSVGILPWCKDENDEFVRDVEMSVYRIDYDGGFTEIGSQLPNEAGVFVVDPHPPLNYARYRIVATSLITGAISFFDIDSIEINIPSIILQWNETIYNQAGYLTDEEDRPTYINGTMLKLDWNIDTSHSHGPDVELVEYIGRSHPVSYYGTQKKETANWNVEIPITDTESLSQIRHLANYAGDVYVREPSGTGYWAQVKVSYNTKHNTTTIPITLSISRVEGGM